MVEIQCQMKKISLVKKFTQDVPLYFNSDPKRIQQIITNLLSNAIKFTKANGQIQLSVSLLQNSQSVIQIDVSDTGIGISKDNLKSLF